MFERSSFRAFSNLKLNGYHYRFAGGAKGKKPKQKTKTKNRQQDGLIANRSGDHKPNACETWNQITDVLRHVATGVLIRRIFACLTCVPVS